MERARRAIGRIMGAAMSRVMDNCLFGRHVFELTRFGGLCKYCGVVWQTVQEEPGQ